MTPTQLKVRALKKLEENMTKYMDGKIEELEFTDLCLIVVNEFITDFGDL